MADALTITCVGASSAGQTEQDAALNGIPATFGWTLTSGPTYTAGPPSSDVAGYTEGSVTIAVASGVMTVTVTTTTTEVASAAAWRNYLVAELGITKRADGTPLRFQMDRSSLTLESTRESVADLACVPTLAYATSLRVLIIEWSIPPADNLGMTPADWVVTVNGSAKTTFGVACEDGKVSVELTADAFYPISRLPEGSYSIEVAYDGTDTTFKDQVGAGRQIAAFTAAASKAAFPRFDLAVFTGDSGAGGLTGLVPAPAAGDAAAGKYLKADGTWAVAGGGSGLTEAQVRARAFLRC